MNIYLIKLFITQIMTSIYIYYLLNFKLKYHYCCSGGILVAFYNKHKVKFSFLVNLILIKV
jgi:hypothetical protein